VAAGGLFVWVAALLTGHESLAGVALLVAVVAGVVAVVRLLASMR
jgi:hypothetical protein